MNIVEPIREPDKIKEIHKYLEEKNPRDAFTWYLYRIKNIRHFKI